MKRRLTILAVIIFLLYRVLLSQGHLQRAEQKRLALVIGNGNYTSSILANPENDARAMKLVLLKLGFTVFEYENLSQNRMKKAIDEFGAQLKGNDVGLFYYAGHGIQAKGFNYLIPVDAECKAEEQVEYDCVRADRILSLMESSGTRVNIIILDACRNNPFERSWTRSASGRGLAFMDAPKGTLIAYATSPGTTASDGAGENGLYTSAILESILMPGLNVIQMFQNVRNTVTRKSANQQTPWESTSLTEDFYFNPVGVSDTLIRDNSETVLSKLRVTNGTAETFVDQRDNHQYRIISIGKQVWMAENIAYDPGSGSWTYENNTAGALVYGRLYDWITAKLVCPEGWHLPGNEEWLALANYLGGDSVAGGKLKETGTRHWKSPNTGAGNQSGFTALPGGMRRADDGRFYNMWDYGTWWSATDSLTFNAWAVYLSYNDKILWKSPAYKRTGYSVRCMKD